MMSPANGIALAAILVALAAAVLVHAQQDPTPVA